MLVVFVLKKASGLHLLFIVYIVVKNYLFNSEFSRHAHILVMFLLGKNDRN